MTPMQIVFLFIAALTLGAAIMVVNARRMMHAALWLVLSLFGVAMTFATLESGFFTVVQVVVYIGAIAILIIFGVMLTRRDLQEEAVPHNRSMWAAALTTTGVFVALAMILSSLPAFNSLPTQAHVEDVAALGVALVSPDGYVVPFEAASILLIGALIGAIYIAVERKP